MNKNKYIEKLLQEEGRTIEKLLDLEKREDIYNEVEILVRRLTHFNFGRYPLELTSEEKGDFRITKDTLTYSQVQKSLPEVALGWARIEWDGNLVLESLTEKGKRIRQNYISSLLDKQEPAKRSEPHSTGYSLIYWGI